MTSLDLFVKLPDPSRFHAIMGAREVLDDLCGYSLQGGIQRWANNTLSSMMQSCESLNVEIVYTEKRRVVCMLPRRNVLYGRMTRHCILSVFFKKTKIYGKFTHGFKTQIGKKSAKMKNAENRKQKLRKLRSLPQPTYCILYTLYSILYTLYSIPSH